MQLHLARPQVRSPLVRLVSVVWLRDQDSSGEYVRIFFLAQPHNVSGDDQVPVLRSRVHCDGFPRPYRRLFSASWPGQKRQDYQVVVMLGLTTLITSLGPETTNNESTVTNSTSTSSPIVESGTMRAVLGQPIRLASTDPVSSSVSLVVLYL